MEWEGKRREREREREVVTGCYIFIFNSIDSIHSFFFLLSSCS